MASRRQRCTAKSKRTQEQCKSWAMPNGKCYYHGGAQPKGLASANTKTGYYSNHMPTRYAARQDELEAAQDLKDMNKDVAMLTLRIQQLAERIDVGDYGSSYKKLQSLYAHSKQNLQQALSGNNPKAIQDFIDYFNEIGLVIERGASDYNTWVEISDKIHDRRQVIGEISKIEYRGQKAVTLDTMMMLMGKLAEHFNRVNHIQDEDERREAFRDGQDSLLRFVE